MANDLQTTQDTAPALDLNAYAQSIMQAAKDPSVDPNKLHLLLDAQERLLNYQAKVAYNQAFALMQPKIPEVVAKGRIDIGKGPKQKFAKFEDIQKAIKPILQEFGFTLSFRTGYEGDFELTTTVLTHRLGHSEQTTIRLPRDASGSKNAVQGVGSSQSYGQRYGVKALLNITVVGDDDDGEMAGAKTINKNQVDIIIRKLGGPGERVAKFCRFHKVASVDEILASAFDRVVAEIDNVNSKAE